MGTQQTQGRKRVRHPARLRVMSGCEVVPLVTGASVAVGSVVDAVSVASGCCDNAKLLLVAPLCCCVAVGLGG
jgi:hypothetical protein